MWQLASYDSLASTSDLARKLPAWNAVCARRQTAGRGRFGRAFVSDEGGLWISAVLPAGKDPAMWTGFSLMVGNHLLRMLRHLGLPDARLRWPNDVMARDKKLAGLLIEQGAQETLNVGLGLNVRNAPWEHDASLEPTTTRLADLLSPPPELSDLAVCVLDALADAHEHMLTGGFYAAVEEFNANLEPRQVEISLLEGGTARGHFTGLDPSGNLIIVDPAGIPQTIPHPQVERLREVAAPKVCRP
ncbi:MAG: biotin--[acetyl-CoA-carboxylase] ligase, partial [Terrimicrobiaceae bacterium]